MRRLYIVGGRNQYVGDNQYMGRRFGRDIAEGGDQFVLINHVGGNFATNDFTENGFFSHGAVP